MTTLAQIHELEERKRAAIREADRINADDSISHYEKIARGNAAYDVVFRVEKELDEIIKAHQNG